MVARNGLSDRYPRKNQTFRQMPNSFPISPKLLGSRLTSRNARATKFSGRLSGPLQTAITCWVWIWSRARLRMLLRVIKLHLQLALLRVVVGSAVIVIAGASVKWTAESV